MNRYDIYSKLRNFFQGRYGQDGFSFFLFALSLIASFFPYGIIVSYILLGYILFRMLSKNISKRQKEAQVFNRILGYRLRKLFFFLGAVTFKAYKWIKKKISFMQMKIRDRKTYKYFRCKNCNHILKVPKGKGTLKVTCPVCKNQIRKKT